MNPFQSLHSYEYFVYTLQQHHQHIVYSTLTIKQTGRLFAEVIGDLILGKDYRLSIYELLVLNELSLVIDAYSDEAWQNTSKLYWYDSQPHPHIPELASTDPHHKHVPPNIKRNRIPAPELSFLKPNLPFLIQELATLVDE